MKCLNCTKSLSKGQIKYCSHTCSHSHMGRLATEEWLRGERAGCEKSGNLKRFVRRYVLKRDDNRCVICGQVNVWNGAPLVLQVDHINGNRGDNRPDNLRSLCPNCHTQTPTYASRNKNK